jgi:hypothetical protein
MKKLFNLLYENLLFIVLGLGVSSLIMTVGLVLRSYLVAPVSTKQILLFLIQGIVMIAFCTYGILHEKKQTKKSIS